MIAAGMFLLNSYVLIRLILIGMDIDTQREVLIVSVLNVVVLAEEILLGLK